jgi:hypothetical protein
MTRTNMAELFAEVDRLSDADLGLPPTAAAEYTGPPMTAVHHKIVALIDEMSDFLMAHNGAQPAVVRMATSAILAARPLVVRQIAAAPPDLIVQFSSELGRKLLDVGVHELGPAPAPVVRPAELAEAEAPAPVPE